MEKKKPKKLSLKQQLQQKEQEINNYIDHLKRLQAEFENYKKYIEKEKINFQLYSKKDILLELLNTLDDFERALNNIKDEEAKKGISIIYSNLKKLLQQQGVTEIQVLNQTFDPYKHEVVTYEKGEDNKILEEIQKGYMLNDKILRYSKVKIGKGEKNEKNISNK